ncbi:MULTISPECIES: phosphatase PAP2 family protein [Clostridium]|uniref:PAP2 family protein n=1 Tax=Clostridium sartagoforme AAU1 TaxID=1202534 RepID=R9CE15_9CLOT|nr:MULTISPECIES: phosphatase PAP2 family protein [Clostridium]EOR27542.1 PAP2 family protein [Clostridium sartagoforme AAU1]KLE15856.1 phosphoesterase [Clostridium sp. C8]
MWEYINFIDLRILEIIRTYFSSSFMDSIMVLITKLGDRGLIWIIISVILLVSKKYKRIGITMIVALLLTSIIGEGIIKNIIQRPRVFNSINDIELIIKAPSSYSFPSGHTASSFAAAMVLGYYIKEYKYLFYFLAFLVAFSRLYLWVHYPSDIVGGMIFGIICGYIAIKIINNIVTKKNS